MRHAIETAPKDGTAVILEHDPTGTHDVAHWSAEVGKRVTENGEPSKITPTHWRPLPDDIDFQLEPGRTHASSRFWPSSPAYWTVLIAAVLANLYFDFGQQTRTESVAPRQQAEAGQAGAEAKAIHTQQAVEASGTRRAVEGPDVQLQTAAASHAQSFEGERQRTAALEGSCRRSSGCEESIAAAGSVKE
jgi:hypothetical protein